MKCRKCGSETLALHKEPKSPHTSLICADCGAWQKFASKDERRIYKNIKEIKK